MEQLLAPQALPAPPDRSTADEEMELMARQTLKWSLAPAASIEIKVCRLWITIRGRVDWGYQRLAAERALGRIAGVRGVTNLLQLRSEPPTSEAVG